MRLDSGDAKDDGAEYHADRDVTGQALELLIEAQARTVRRFNASADRAGQTLLLRRLDREQRYETDRKDQEECGKPMGQPRGVLLERRFVRKLELLKLLEHLRRERRRRRRRFGGRCDGQLRSCRGGMRRAHGIGRAEQQHEGMIEGPSRPDLREDRSHPPAVLAAYRKIPGSA